MATSLLSPCLFIIVAASPGQSPAAAGAEHGQAPSAVAAIFRGLLIFPHSEGHPQLRQSVRLARPSRSNKIWQIRNPLLAL